MPTRNLARIGGQARQGGQTALSSAHAKYGANQWAGKKMPAHPTWLLQNHPTERRLQLFIQPWMGAKPALRTRPFQPCHE